MSSQQDDESRPLGILGISAWDERVYRWLLAHPRASASEVARALRLSPGRAQRLLDTIEAKGLSTHTPERPRRYIPASPDIAIEGLALQHHQAVQRAQDMITELQEEASTQRHGQQEQMLELVSNREAERQILEHMQRSAQRELITFMRAPMRISRLDLSAAQENPAQVEAQARGVRYRSIADTKYLELPGVLHSTMQDVEAGEEVGVVPHLPFKMVLADRHLALIPLNLQEPDSPSLLVRSSALLDALYFLFEILHERAVPIPFTRSGTVKHEDGAHGLPPEALRLVKLMASGLNDKKIAHELSISTRTLERRVSELMQGLGTRTRFQVGWLTALRLERSGLVPASEPHADT